MAKIKDKQSEIAGNNQTLSVTPQCKVLIFPWKEKDIQQFGFSKGSYIFKSSDLADTEVFDVSSRVMDCSFSKSMNSPSGTFSFRLSNSSGVANSKGDWKDIIKPGTWCMIYLSQHGDLKIQPDVAKVGKLETSEGPRLRCMGYIERVAVNAGVDSKGAFDVTYDISGRDFGVVYEETTIWHNMFKFENIILNNVLSSKLNVISKTPITDVVRVIHDLFMYPKHIKGLKTKLGSNDSLLEIGLQWLLPKELVKLLGVKGKVDTYAGNIFIKNFKNTVAAISNSNPMGFLSGNAWQKLKSLSVPQLHELFTELSAGGVPTLTFRPIPFAMNKKPYGAVAEPIMEYKDLDSVRVNKVNILSFDLGEDDHSRYNSFLMQPASSLIGSQDMVSLLSGSEFPLHNFGSIKRHGFRPMHITVDSLVRSGAGNDDGDRPVIVGFCKLMVDYWNFAIYGESGDLRLIGLNSIKLGKALKFEAGTPYVASKQYYIEGYADHFTIDEKGAGVWEQTVQLTRGFDEDILKELSKTDPTKFSKLKKKLTFSNRAEAFTEEGEYTPAKIKADS